MAEIDPSALNDSLRRLHRNAIVSLAACAVAIGVTALLSPSQAQDQVASSYSVVALVLAAAAILLRRSSAAPRRSLRGFVYASVLSMLGAVGLGLLGLLVTLRESQTLVGLLYTLAGALLVLRPPAVIHARTGS